MLHGVYGYPLPYAHEDMVGWRKEDGMEGRKRGRKEPLRVIGGSPLSGMTTRLGLATWRDQAVIKTGFPFCQATLRR
jgi:hypothetical protein